MSPNRLRPFFVALSAIALAATTVSPAIALPPPAAASGATIQAGASPFFLAAVRVASGVGASAAAQATITRAGTIATRPAVTKAAGSAIGRPKLAKATPAPTFHGTNHVWIPALGVSRAISIFPCSRQKAPANYVYRWGCAGTNNVYLLGHAYGVFKALHDAYYNGRLKVGLTAIYANASGTVHTYRVAWWKVVKPTTAAKWAWASLASPSMTLQTCLGASSQYRLMVRLVQVK
jgi:Sortase domain